MNPFTDFPMLDPTTIKRFILILFVMITFGVKLSDILEKRKSSDPTSS